MGWICNDFFEQAELGDERRTPMMQPEASSFFRPPFAKSAVEDGLLLREVS